MKSLWRWWPPSNWCACVWIVFILHCFLSLSSALYANKVSSTNCSCQWSSSNTPRQCTTALPHTAGPGKSSTEGGHHWRQHMFCSFYLFFPNGVRLEWVLLAVAIRTSTFVCWYLYFMINVTTQDCMFEEAVREMEICVWWVNVPGGLCKNVSKYEAVCLSLVATAIGLFAPLELILRSMINTLWNKRIGHEIIQFRWTKIWVQVTFQIPLYPSANLSLYCASSVRLCILVVVFGSHVNWMHIGHLYWVYIF